MAAHEAACVGERRRRQPEKTRDFDAGDPYHYLRHPAIIDAMRAMARVPTLDWSLNLFVDVDATAVDDRADGRLLGNHAVMLMFSDADRGPIVSHRRSALGTTSSGITR